MMATKQIVLIRRNGNVDYAPVVGGSPVQPVTSVRPGARDTDGYLLSDARRDHVNSLYRQIGPTVECREAGVKVGASEVEILAGPYDAESGVVHTPAGDIKWVPGRQCYAAPDGTEHQCLSAALAYAVGVPATT